ncbi:NAD(P)H-hydrate dehydratase [Rhizobiaceae bacterium n13]|uniref:Bifunctional NAD(P)H-hydrate repair enzyme n=1 Tax=Ferirhizobium litorale TaxID=2927786 RepID=A0AAE3U225_9HYPH|nr:NAD(P)H-hydrate dehydratase [Fererhizobium litorale]MDI7863184.1 NAD(P)H-hydrate dehydratase [Fererhizobium litorale]MDI7923081.1 NAD(P)H-hydrate dehydratase [Fererhizobium litorale]
MNASISRILLTPDEMAAADAAAASSGIDSYGLMERAGQAAAASALRHFPGASRFVALCGPGNNGGDGYVAARALAASGAPTAVFALGDTAKLRGDAARAFANCSLDAEPLSDYAPQPGDVVIDAIFGAGLSRDVPTEVEDVIARVDAANVPIVAVDLPSGLCGRRGTPLGASFRAARTVTFMTRKPGHLLLPGRKLCGEVEVFDIGIPHRVIHSVAGRLVENGPERWADAFPHAGLETHKFKRGHLVVFSGGRTATGAARLSAMAGLRTGAGLVTIASPPEAVAVNANALTAVMLHGIDDLAALKHWLTDSRLSGFVLGPGFGVGERARQFALALAARPLVLDADGITSFRDQPELLFSRNDGGTGSLVLTPHEGEFARLFPDIAATDMAGKVEKAIAAAERANAIVVYKGADTVIAAPDGRAAINANAPPWLATAGSGDVLAGIIGGLLAQGMPAFEAACAGVYLHGQAGQRAGVGLTAEDLPRHVLPLYQPALAQ